MIICYNSRNEFYKKGKAAVTEEAVKELPKLSKKHSVFVDNYFILNMHGTNAYVETYGTQNRDTARKNASRLLTRADIKAHIKHRLEEKHMSADEALSLLADIARGDIGNYINDFGMVDVSQARKDGITRLIKKWRTKTVTINGKSEDKEVHTEEIELYPADAAIRDVLKVHQKFKQNLDITSGGEKIEQVVQVYIPNNERDD